MMYRELMQGWLWCHSMIFYYLILLIVLMLDLYEHYMNIKNR